MAVEHKITIDKAYSDILQQTTYNNSLLTVSKAVEYYIHVGHEDFKNIPFDRFFIHNRRYMGSKAKLLNFIERSIKEVIGEFYSFVDIFSGTGVVGHHFNTSDKQIIFNDLLYSNYITNVAFLSSEGFDYKKIDDLLKEFNNIKGKINYFSKYFGNKFFSMDTAKKIGTIREKIENLYKNKEINFREKAILITSLIYAADKIANTCGHYDSYRKNGIFKDSLILKHLDIFHNNNQNNLIFNEDANKLFNYLNFKVDIIYADPPYNSRQYSSLYHVLENLARWTKPKVEGKASKMVDRTKLNSAYCTKTAIKALEELIDNINAKYFILSYSNMGKKGNDRSNARMDDNDIINLLKSKGELIIKFTNHQAFSTGKSLINNHEERLFICKLNKNNIKI